MNRSIVLGVAVVLVAVVAAWVAFSRRRGAGSGAAGWSVTGHAARDEGDDDGRALRCRVANVRTGQRVADAPPYFSPGGDWTVADVSAIDDPGARFTLAFPPTPKPTSSKVPFSFSDALVLAEDADAGGRMVAKIAAAFGQAAPAAKAPQPLRPLRFKTVVLGEHLGKGKAHGFGPDNSGTWTATKWFLSDGAAEAEIYFNYDLASGAAEFTEKDADYNADVVNILAEALRDGPRPPRTPQTDPNLTDAGPRVVDLRPIPVAPKSYASFDPGGKLVVLTGSHEHPDVLRAVRPETPDQVFELARVERRMGPHLLADPDGTRLVVEEQLPEEENTFSTNDPSRLWWFERTGATPASNLSTPPTGRQLQGPWGQHGSFAGEKALSPGGRYLAVSAYEETKDETGHRRPQLFFLDLQTNAVKQADLAGRTAEVVGWADEGAAARALLLTGSRWEKAARRPFVADPATGACTPARTGEVVEPDPLVSPDRRHRVALVGKEGFDVVEIETGKSRRFTFHEDDRRFVQEGCLEWRGPRYVGFGVPRLAVIDIETLKMSYLISPDDRGRYTFSPDFRRALRTDGKTVSIGRVELPQGVAP